jgi:FKBP-type peptidyl-prolyl cis-trans isomerase
MDIKTFLEENQIQASRTEDNLYYTIEEAGEGEHPQAGQYVKVHYTGTFLDGKKIRFLSR